MRLVVLANDILKDEWMIQGVNDLAEIIWAGNVQDMASHKDADGYIDLLYDHTPRRVKILKDLGKTVIVNSVIHTVDDTFVRINGWPGFLKRNIAEVSSANSSIQQQAEEIITVFNRKTCWVPGEPGFITARVVAMIINEAYFTLSEEVSTKEEIDTAMKLGTNYPYGPFEWSTKIGLKNIEVLLSELAIKNPRYKPAPLLKKDAAQ